MLDLFNRQVVDGSLKPRMTADIVTDALTMAWLGYGLVMAFGYGLFQEASGCGADASR